MFRFNIGSNLRDLIAYSIVLVILIFRPHGLFGQAYSAKLTETLIRILRRESSFSYLANKESENDKERVTMEETLAPKQTGGILIPGGPVF
jgi:hypothetical protein